MAIGSKRVVCESCYHEFYASNGKSFTCPTCRDEQKNKPKPVYENKYDDCIVVYDPDVDYGLVIGSNITMLEIDECIAQGTVAQGFIFRKGTNYFIVKGKEKRLLTYGELLMATNNKNKAKKEWQSIYLVR